MTKATSLLLGLQKELISKTKKSTRKLGDFLKISEISFLIKPREERINLIYHKNIVNMDLLCSQANSRMTRL